MYSRPPSWYNGTMDERKTIPVYTATFHRCHEKEMFYACVRALESAGAKVLYGDRHNLTGIATVQFAVEDIQRVREHLPTTGVWDNLFWVSSDGFAIPAGEYPGSSRQAS